VTKRVPSGRSGASAAKDGVDAIETDATNCMNLPAEALELDAPIRVHRIALRRDSGGAGTRRGGLGIVREYEILHGPVRFTHRGERHFVAPKGRAGGHDGAMAHSVIHRADGREEPIPSKLVTELHKGDRVVLETAGGGGHGDPARRAPEQVEADRANGKVSAEGAAIYPRPQTLPPATDRK
jgi:N-methylhydantoinase B/oxoprolinase/acetone carboxylase alpha subunit